MNQLYTRVITCAECEHGTVYGNDGVTYKCDLWEMAADDDFWCKEGKAKESAGSEKPTIKNAALTYKQAKWACEMLRLGFKQHQIAEALSCEAHTLIRNLKRYGLPTKFESFELVPLKYEEEE